MTRESPAITVDRHVALGNMFKDVYDELADIINNSGANDLIVDRANNTLVAINRLMIALAHDLNQSASVDTDPRFILERVYSGDDRFEFGPDAELDVFFNWREVVRP